MKTKNEESIEQEALNDYVRWNYNWKKASDRNANIGIVIGIITGILIVIISKIIFPNNGPIILGSYLVGISCGIFIAIIIIQSYWWFGMEKGKRKFLNNLSQDERNEIISYYIKIKQ